MDDVTEKYEVTTVPYFVFVQVRLSQAGTPWTSTPGACRGWLAGGQSHHALLLCQLWETSKR